MLPRDGLLRVNLHSFCFKMLLDGICVLSISVAICVHRQVAVRHCVCEGCSLSPRRCIRLIVACECRLWFQQLSCFKVDDSDIWQTQQFLMSAVVYPQCASRTSAWCGEVLGLVGVVNAEIVVSQLNARYFRLGLPSVDTYFMEFPKFLLRPRSG